MWEGNLVLAGVTVGPVAAWLPNEAAYQANATAQSLPRDEIHRRAQVRRSGAKRSMPFGNPGAVLT